MPENDSFNKLPFLFREGRVEISFSSQVKPLLAFHFCGDDFQRVTANKMKIRYVNAGDPMILFFCPECGFNTRASFFEDRTPNERIEVVQYSLETAANKSWEKRGRACLS